MFMGVNGEPPVLLATADLIKQVKVLAVQTVVQRAVDFPRATALAATLPITSFAGRGAEILLGQVFFPVQGPQQRPPADVRLPNSRLAASASPSKFGLVDSSQF